MRCCSSFRLYQARAQVRKRTHRRPPLDPSHHRLPEPRKRRNEVENANTRTRTAVAKSNYGHWIISMTATSTAANVDTVTVSCRPSSSRMCCTMWTTKPRIACHAARPSHPIGTKRIRTRWVCFCATHVEFDLKSTMFRVLVVIISSRVFRWTQISVRSVNIQGRF